VIHPGTGSQAGAVRVVSHAANILPRTEPSSRMTATSAPPIDPVAARRWARIAPPRAPWLHEEVARRMVERLQWIRLQPRAWAHWGPVRGGAAAQQALAKRYPDARCLLVEDAPDRLAAAETLRPAWWQARRWTGPDIALRVPSDGEVQLLWSNMALHADPDPLHTLSRWHRALSADGFLMFSCLGPDTLRELRDIHARLGWSKPTQAFVDMHDWCDLLIQSGFAEPVMDVEHITLTYSTADTLLADLREWGRNLDPERAPVLRGRAWLARWREAVTQGLSGRGDAPDRLSLRFEIIYGHAFKPMPRAAVAPVTAVPLSEMRLALRQRKA
jgi:malonyl-CoA O-methyltransferase